MIPDKLGATGRRQRRSRRLGHFVFAVPLLLAGLLAACGNGDDEVEAIDPSPEETETPEPWPPPTPTPEPVVKIDVVATAQAAECEVTHGNASNDPWLFEMSPQWIDSGSFLISPVSPDGNWYTGDSAIAMWTESRELLDEAIELTGSHRESCETIQSAGLEHVYDVPNGVMAMATFEVPSEGCWDLAVGDHEFIAYVLPEEQHPDVVSVSQLRADTVPYEPPASCQISDWRGPTRGPGLPVGFWLDDAAVDVYSEHILFYTDRSLIFIISEDDDVVVDGQSASNPAVTLRSEIQRASGGATPLVSAHIVFPVSGCWDISIEAESRTVEATVYVHPEECRRNPGEELPRGCIVPE